MVRSPDAVALAEAAATLRAGGLVGLPTETVYGLAADATNPTAVAKIFAAKGRPSDHPLIVHVADAGGVGHFAASVPGFAQRLMAAFWPGPLTLILPRRPEVAAAAAGGQDSVGLRCPAHPVAQALLRACAEMGVPGLAAPSANLFGRVSPTTAAHVLGEFGSDLLVLDGGPCRVGIESTIVDCSRGVPVLLRPGQLTPEPCCRPPAASRCCCQTPCPARRRAPPAPWRPTTRPAAKVRLDGRQRTAADRARHAAGRGQRRRSAIAVWSRTVLQGALAAGAGPPHARRRRRHRAAAVRPAARL